MDQGRSTGGLLGRAALALLLLSLLLPGTAAAAERLRVASWNLQAFGPKKAHDPAVMAVVGRVLRRFDVVAVQEIRDRTGVAPGALAAATGEARYGVVVGPRLGRSASKEQYALLFDPRTVEALGPAVTVSSAASAFHRPPLAARFRARAGGFTFVLVDVHVDPDDARAEIEALPRALEELRARFPGEDDVILVGDLNADCGYFDETAPVALRGPGYAWLIGDDLDTTVKPTDCTYDRIVIGAAATAADYAGRAGVFDFREAFRLGAAEAARVSDHFPIWAEFHANREDAAPSPIGTRADPRM